VQVSARVKWMSRESNRQDLSGSIMLEDEHLFQLLAHGGFLIGGKCK